MAVPPISAEDEAARAIYEKCKVSISLTLLLRPRRVPHWPAFTPLDTHAPPPPPHTHTFSPFHISLLRPAATQASILGPGPRNNSVAQQLYDIQQVLDSDDLAEVRFRLLYRRFCNDDEDELKPEVLTKLIEVCQASRALSIAIFRSFSFVLVCDFHSRIL